MNRALSLLFAVLMGMSTVWTAETVAQTQQPPVQEPSGPAGPAPARPDGREPSGTTKKQIEGKIKSVDPSGATTKVILEDGTQLTIPGSVKVQRASLKEGVTLKATYQENRGQKVVTSIQVQPES